MRKIIPCTWFVIGFLFLAASLRAAEPGVEFFEKKIRPVLIDQCYSCHSVEAEKVKKLKGGLLLDSRAGILRGGDSGPVLVPGKPAESLLWKAMKFDGKTQMPPKGKLADSVLADFEAWIKMGAPDPRSGEAAPAKRTIDVEKGKEYWAYRPIPEITPPSVKNTTWGKTPIDRFILAKLEAKSLSPNTPASKEKLIRRATYDLTGLPPTSEEIESFVKDTSPNAFEKVIDRLLQSERFGERWARHWLDAVRFAESGGYEFDKDRPGAYHYRDFVIRAFNQDMPYDEFVRLQLAGDHLKPNDINTVSATGFLVAGPYPGQTTAKTVELIRYDHLDDMLSTIGNSMLGTSLGCVRCHEHKYDPIPHDDYYKLLAALARTDSVDAKIDSNPEATRKAKEAFAQVHQPLVAARDRFEKEEFPKRVKQWFATGGSPGPRLWTVLQANDPKGKSALKKLDDGSLLATDKADKVDTYTFNARTYLHGITSLRIEALADDSLPKKGPGRGPEGTFLLTEVIVTATPLEPANAKAVAIKWKPGKTTINPEKTLLAGVLDADKKTGWSIGTEVGKNHAAVLEADTPFGFAAGTNLTITLKFEGDGYAIGRTRVSIAQEKTPAATGPTSLQPAVELANLLGGNGEITDKNRAGLRYWWRTFDPEMEKIYAAVELHAKQEPQPKLQTVFAASSGRGGDVYFLIRGEVERKKGVAKPGYMQVMTNAPTKDQHWLTPNAKGAPTVELRVALGNWITDPKMGAGALTARVFANRLWQHHFGVGIVATPNDFGVQGEPPTHPELLDYLANELIRNGWKTKSLHKLIMLSAVYQQDVTVNEAAQKVDPLNKFLWRKAPRRLEAEAIRDALLSVSGTMDLTMYGPGTLDGNSARRSVYLTVKRSQMVSMMQMFDAPEAIQSIGERSRTTVPTQALAFMNSPLVRQKAEKLAQRIRPSPDATVEAIVNSGYRVTMGRTPTATEREKMAAFVRAQTESYGKAPRATDQALVDFCQVLLCLNEFIYVD